MSLLAALTTTAFALGCAPQNTPVPEDLFVKNGENPVTISADRRAVTAAEGLERLGIAMNWIVVFQTPGLRNNLVRVSLDLAFQEEDPRIVAQLIAAAANADVLFSDGTLQTDKVTMHVVKVPDEFSDEGQQRLRARATQWYQNFLVDEIQRDPTFEDDAMRVRMQVGELLRDSGDLDGAIRFFEQIPSVNRLHDLVLPAMLRVAQCHYDMGEYPKAEEWARRVLDRRAGLPAEWADGVVLLGRILLATGRYRECILSLESRALKLERRPAILDVYLLLAECHFQLNQPARALERTESLLHYLSDWRELTEEQWLSYHFLRGYGLAQTDRHAEGIRFLEWFLIRADGDERRGMAFVLLSQAYLDAGQFLEARAAAVEATSAHLKQLEPNWRRQARKLMARTALSLGDKEEAFDQLEREVIQHRDPELTLFLVDEFLADRRWQRAINTARGLLEHSESDYADQGRLRIVKAQFEQSKNARNWDGFTEQAERLAMQMAESSLRVEVLETIAAAYESMGEYVKAADRIRGIIK